VSDFIEQPTEWLCGQKSVAQKSATAAKQKQTNGNFITLKDFSSGPLRAGVRGAE